MALAKDIMGGGFSAGAAVAIGGSVGTVAAAGNSQGTAAEIKFSNGIVTAADGTKGVILPACQPGESIFLFNNSGSTLKVYPPSGAAIAVGGTGLGAGDAAFSQLTYKHTRYVCYSSTQWFALTGV